MLQQIHKYGYREDRVLAAALLKIADALGVDLGTFFEGIWLHGRTGQEPQRFT